MNKISCSVFNVLNKILTFQMKNCDHESVMESYIPYWIILQQDIQNLFNYFLSIILHLLVKGSKIYIHPSFINISKQMNIKQECMMVPIVIGQLCMHSRNENSKKIEFNIDL